MSMTDIRMLYAFNKWANDRTLESLKQLTDEQFTRQIGGSFPSIQDTAAHIAGAEWVWNRRWLGESPMAMPDWMKGMTLASLLAKFAELESERAAFIAKLTDTDLMKPSTFTMFNGKSDTQPLQYQLQHLVNHGSYHRGQVATMLRQVGVKPTGTDFIGYARTLASA